MEITDVEKAIREYLAQVVHLSLATERDGAPWVCEVHYVYDDDLNLYFRSLTNRRHSQEITANNRVAGNIVAQHAVGEKVRAVYFEGTCEKLSGIGESHPIYELFRGRLGAGPEILEEAQREDGHQFYQITVNSYYLFDSRESDPAKKYELAWENQSTHEAN